MTISFVTIEGGCVVKKTFPKISNNTVTLGVDVSKEQQCKDSATAEVAAKKFAELNKLTYVSENQSVIVVSPLSYYYLPVELTPAGKVIGRGTTTISMQAAAKEAESVAAYNKLVFIKE